MNNCFEGAVGILGGSFNPVHNGHLRMAIEALENLGLSRVDFLPAKCSPHKVAQGLLGFDQRVELLKRAIAGLSGLGICTLEGEMPAPSYSYETLIQLGLLHPDTRHVFIMGSPDVLTVPQWHRGLELPFLTDIAVLDRLGLGLDTVDTFLRTHWDVRTEGHGLRRIAGGKRIRILPMARLDISSSLVREKILAGLEIRGLVPEGVRERIGAQRKHFTACWQSRP